MKARSRLALCVALLASVALTPAPAHADIAGGAAGYVTFGSEALAFDVEATGFGVGAGAAIYLPGDGTSVPIVMLCANIFAGAFYEVYAAGVGRDGAYFIYLQLNDLYTPSGVQYAVVSRTQTLDVPCGAGSEPKKPIDFPSAYAVGWV